MSSIIVYYVCTDKLSTTIVHLYSNAPIDIMNMESERNYWLNITYLFVSKIQGYKKCILPLISPLILGVLEASSYKQEIRFDKQSM